MSTLTLQSKLKLRDGNEIPRLGFGTYELDGQDAYQGVFWALERSLHLLFCALIHKKDSAAWYENEKECGQAILDFCKSTGISRSEIFFTTKLKLNNGYANVKKAIQKSVNECGLGYIDLYLIHGPIGGPKARKESWQAVCDAHAEGKLKSIGISTYGVGHMQEMVDAKVPLPVITQIDLHPFMTRTDVVAFCKKHEIAMEGYVPLPKSASKGRIVENTQIFDFELEAEEVAHLDTLDEGLTTDWDPTHEP
ncbi:hypothetical protein HWV62_4545 [Athelia sp. TMB]|nr:hypothetical protein HWV62_4545 [Athelia sp. TMB]